MMSDVFLLAFSILEQLTYDVRCVSVGFLDFRAVVKIWCVLSVSNGSQSRCSNEVSRPQGPVLVLTLSWLDTSQQ